MMASNHYHAYWISPTGRVMPVSGSHIEFVIENSEWFSLSLPEIKAVYRRYREPIGSEGTARNAIMAKLLRHGWIRVRFRPRAGQFIVQVDRLTKVCLRHIRSWAKSLSQTDRRNTPPAISIINLKLQELGQMEFTVPS